ncbi:MAG: RsmD family RNA methyltransferase [archaeon]|nr:RsmD family RNA methyltransferase [Candidatus Micrarchaeota archaeon]
MNNKYLFVLGRDYLLSLAELISYFKARNFKYRLINFNEDVALVEGSEEIDLLRVIRELGGTVKIAEVFFEGTGKKEMENAIEKKIDSIFFPRKFFYGINYFTGEREKPEFIENLLKKKFKEMKAKAVLKRPKFVLTEKGSKQINPSEVIKWRLIGEGMDLVVYSFKDNYFIGRSVACFNPFEVRKRDEGRPHKRSLEAISLRLGKILVNLSQCKAKETVLDPFCGIGTISMESLSNGLNTIGVEIDSSTAKKARENLGWYSNKYVCNNSWKIINGNATQLSKLLNKGDFDTVATEPYLGPLMKELPSEEQARRTIKALEEMYEKFFRELRKLMKEGRIVSIIFPVIPSKKGKKFAVSENVFRKNGFEIINPLKEVKRNAVPLVYKDEKNRIERLIYVLRNKGKNS